MSPRGSKTPRKLLAVTCFPSGAGVCDQVSVGWGRTEGGFKAQAAFINLGDARTGSGRGEDSGCIPGSAEGCSGQGWAGGLSRRVSMGWGGGKCGQRHPWLLCFASLGPIFSVEDMGAPPRDAGRTGCSHAAGGTGPAVNERCGQGVGVSSWGVAGDWDLFIADDTHQMGGVRVPLCLGFLLSLAGWGGLISAGTPTGHALCV